ncbi:MAG: hypothetical protein ACK5JM_14495 [Rhodoblastus sp.]
MKPKAMAPILKKSRLTTSIFADKALAGQKNTPAGQAEGAQDARLVAKSPAPAL